MTNIEIKKKNVSSVLGFFLKSERSELFAFNLRVVHIEGSTSYIVEFNNKHSEGIQPSVISPE